MAKAKVVHSDDSCTVIIKGDKNSPEPTTTIIKFPGGEVEVARCSDGKSYWAHLQINESAQIIDSRVDYDVETYRERSASGLKEIPEIENQEGVRKMAIRLIGQFE